MPIISPQIPEGLPELMRGLAKSVIKQNPDNLYEFAAEYFENLLRERDGDQGYKQFATYKVYKEHKKRNRNARGDSNFTSSRSQVVENVKIDDKVKSSVSSEEADSKLEQTPTDNGLIQQSSSADEKNYKKSVESGSLEKIASVAKIASIESVRSLHVPQPTEDATKGLANEDDDIQNMVLDEEMEQAALKIQSTFRGHKVRKDFNEQPAESSTLVQNIDQTALPGDIESAQTIEGEQEMNLESSVDVIEGESFFEDPECENLEPTMAQSSMTSVEACEQPTASESITQSIDDATILVEPTEHNKIKTELTICEANNEIASEPLAEGPDDNALQREASQNIMEIMEPKEIEPNAQNVDSVEPSLVDAKNPCEANAVEVEDVILPTQTDAEQRSEIELSQESPDNLMADIEQLGETTKLSIEQTAESLEKTSSQAIDDDDVANMVLDEEMEQAALKIQSSFRGHKARKETTQSDVLSSQTEQSVDKQEIVAELQENLEILDDIQKSVEILKDELETSQQSQEKSDDAVKILEKQISQEMFEQDELMNTSMEELRSDAPVEVIETEVVSDQIDATCDLIEPVLRSSQEQNADSSVPNDDDDVANMVLDEEMEQAALKIQSTFRGHKVRQDFKKDDEPSEVTEETAQKSVEKLLEKIPTVENIPAHIEEISGLVDDIQEAATPDSDLDEQIVETLKRSQSEYHNLSNLAPSLKSSSDTLVPNEEDDVANMVLDEEMEQAALKIQSSFRGHKARKDVNKDIEQPTNELIDEESGEKISRPSIEQDQVMSETEQKSIESNVEIVEPTLKSIESPKLSQELSSGLPDNPDGDETNKDLAPSDDILEPIKSESEIPEEEPQDISTIIQTEILNEDFQEKSAEELETSPKASIEKVLSPSETLEQDPELPDENRQDPIIMPEEIPSELEAQEIPAIGDSKSEKSAEQISHDNLDEETSTQEQNENSIDLIETVENDESEETLNAEISNENQDEAVEAEEETQEETNEDETATQSTAEGETVQENLDESNVETEDTAEDTADDTAEGDEPEEEQTEEEQPQSSTRNDNLTDAEREEIEGMVLDEEMEQAALKIQSTFRGHKTRKDIKQDTKDPTDEATQAMEEVKLTDEPSAPTDDDDVANMVLDEEMEQAALKIQSTFRGHKVRQDNKQPDTPAEEPEKKEEEPPVEEEKKPEKTAQQLQDEQDIADIVMDDDMKNAALKIQSTFRSKKKKVDGSQNSGNSSASGSQRGQGSIEDKATDSEAEANIEKHEDLVEMSRCEPPQILADEPQPQEDTFASENIEQSLDKPDSREIQETNSRNDDNFITKAQSCPANMFYGPNLSTYKSDNEHFDEHTMNDDNSTELDSPEDEFMVTTSGGSGDDEKEESDSNKRSPDIPFIDDSSMELEGVDHEEENLSNKSLEIAETFLGSPVRGADLKRSLFSQDTFKNLSFQKSIDEENFYKSVDHIEPFTKSTSDPEINTTNNSNSKSSEAEATTASEFTDQSEVIEPIMIKRTVTPLTSDDGLKDETGSVENFELSNVNKDSAEALYYSLKKNELETQKQSETTPKAADLEMEDDDDVVMGGSSFEHMLDAPKTITQIGKSLDESKLYKDKLVRLSDSILSQDFEPIEAEPIFDPMLYASMKNKQFMDQMHGHQSSDHEAVEQTVYRDNSMGDEDQFEDFCPGNIRQKMMASSFSIANSDYYDPTKSQVLHDDSIRTALETINSTDSESTTVSAATKIQAGTIHRRLPGASGVSMQYASFGNAAIDKSLEDFIERQDQLVEEDEDPEASARKQEESTEESTEEYDSKNFGNFGVIEIKLEQKKNEDSISNLDLSGDEENDKGLLNVADTQARRIQRLRREDAFQNSTPEESPGASYDKAVAEKSLSTQETVVEIKSKAHESSDHLSKDSKQSAKSLTQSTTVKPRPMMMQRQRSMPVQIDTSCIRLLPKHLRKRIRSAESEKRKKPAK